ncbi:copper amine oxidase N-terminal domain-containing protein [Paenibacillus cymbidii]|uniref:copper amine oxidase N-terminal domain-containing protein n=1 Tax=Paenibacillus cymbidii TaxID=1639034 RepID=UPI0014369649|nr:copper amine oxidase N-terminal domain-containing protein [Paenibacillus cymbidii]
MSKRQRIGASALLALLLLVLAACQAVTGSNVDLTQSGVNALTSKSYQASAQITLERVGKAPADAQAAGLAALAPVTLNLTTIDQQDSKHVYVEGELKDAKAAIPLRFSQSDMKLLFEADGAKQVEFDLSALLSDKVKLNLPIDIGQLSGSLDSMIDAVLPFLIEKLPNAQTVTVAPATETIHGESVSLQRIHIALKGAEFADLYKQLLSGVKGDEAGVQQAIAAMLDAAGLPSAPIVVQLVNNQLQEMLAKLPETPKADLFSDKLALNVDLYVDSDLQTRKLALDLFLPDGGTADGAAGTKMSVTSDLWNVNQAVTAKQLTPAADRLIWSPNLRMAHYLKSADAKSPLYDLLMNDLHITRKTIAMQMSATNEITGSAPYIRGASTMVPVRFVSEQLAADVEWDGDKRQVHITDILTGKTIVLTIDSTKALVNGVEDELEVAAEITDDSTFVPVRFIAEKLGATVGWDEATRTVSIIKP